MTGALLGAQWYMSVTSRSTARSCRDRRCRAAGARRRPQRWLVELGSARGHGRSRVLALPFGLVLSDGSTRRRGAVGSERRGAHATPQTTPARNPDNGVGNPANPGEPERRLFPATSRRRLRCRRAAVRRRDDCLRGGWCGRIRFCVGVNGLGYRWPDEHVAPLRGMRRAGAVRAARRSRDERTRRPRRRARTVRGRTAPVRWTVVVSLSPSSRSVAHASGRVSIAARSEAAVYAWLA